MLLLLDGHLKLANFRPSAGTTTKPLLNHSTSAYKPSSNHQLVPNPDCVDIQPEFTWSKVQLANVPNFLHFDWTPLI